MSEPKNDRKLSFWVPRHLKNSFDTYIPHGMQGLILRNMYEMIVKLTEQYGRGVIGLILAQKLKLVIPEGEEENVSIGRASRQPDQHEQRGVVEEDPTDPR